MEGSIISAYFAKLSINYKNQQNYWYNFRNAQALLVAYYATFSSTVYQESLPVLQLGSLEQYFLSTFLLLAQFERKCNLISLFFYPFFDEKTANFKAQNRRMVPRFQ